MRIFVLLMLLTIPLAADEEMMVIDSIFADYNGQRVTLSGSVVVEHELGKICANKMIMTPADNDKKLRYATLKIKDNVILTLKDGGQLCCGIADLNYKALTGLFTGSTPDEYVVYTDLCHETGGVTTPVVMKSRQIGIVIEREPIVDAGTYKSRISQINTEQQVTVNYNQDFLVTADRCNYLRIAEDEDKGARGVPSEILFSHLADGGNCTVTNKRGDVVHAEEIRINTVERTLAFADPKGTIVPPDQDKDVAPIEFSAGTMVWDDKCDTLFLRDKIELIVKGMGTMVTDREMTLLMGSEGGKKELHSINAQGNTVITRFDEEKSTNYTLTTSGDVHLDMNKLQLVLLKPGVKPDAGEQIHYEDHMGEMLADTATFDYRKEGDVAVPSFLVLEGNVRLVNLANVAKGLTSDSLMQYALADRIEFNPQSKETRLIAKKGKRVLFYDKINNIKMSAPAFKVLRDPLSNKNSIHGIGDVRFSFVEQEIDQLKKRFSFDDEELGNDKR